MSEGSGYERQRPSVIADIWRRYEVHLTYSASGLTYITLGILFPDVLANWFGGAAFLLLTVWLLPAFVRRIWRLL